MDSTLDTQTVVRNQQALDVTEVDAVERSEEAWATALTQAVFEKLPSGIDLQSEKMDAPGHSVAHPSNEPEQVSNGKLSVLRSETTRIARGDATSQLNTEVHAGNLGRVAVQVTRSPQGLNIVINVADARVKSLLSSELHVLLGSLKSSGLPVNSVRIEANPQAGPGLALDRDRLKGGSFQRPVQARLKAYRGTESEEASDSSEESINLTV